MNASPHNTSTAGEIALGLGESAYRIEHILPSSQLLPASRDGSCRVFAVDDVARIGEEVRLIDSQKTEDLAGMQKPMRYYNLRRNWTKKIETHLDDELLNTILVRDFNKFTYGRWRKKFERGMYPADFESCDWWTHHHPPFPRFWSYVKHAACHWLVNFALRLAMLAVPKRPWRILSSDRHSTVWDGRRTLFDFNFQALGIDPQECFELASGDEELPPGEFLEVDYAAHYTEGR